MNYFKFYEIPISFLPDEAEIKRKFYALSKTYHPDFFTLESEEKQAEVLELSTKNNEAYKVLSDPDRRMKYLLELKGALDEEGKAQLPPAFLMEMMDINEQLMELEFDFDEGTFANISTALTNLEQELWSTVYPTLSGYSEETSDAGELNLVKDYYYKKRYLLRIRENLNKFAVR